MAQERGALDGGRSRQPDREPSARDQRGLTLKIRLAAESDGASDELLVDFAPSRSSLL